jgi:inorganic pyrophosphatase/exopolyphosphatase
MITDADGQFIFKENEFEDESFVAAAFVAKYRKVSSLESLKDQLMQYSNALKQQLYNIINRDYKDFITISTKVGTSTKEAVDTASAHFLTCLEPNLSHTAGRRRHAYSSPAEAAT